MATPFPQTVWSEIQRAKAGSPADLARLFEGYRPALLAFLRGRGYQPADAEDIAQEVFAVILEDCVLAGADRAKGRFRSLLLAVTRHVISARRRKARAGKRGGGARLLRLDDPVGPGRETLLAEVVAARDRDPEFDAAWTQVLLKRAFDAFRAQCEKRGRDDFEILRAHIEDRLASPEIAARFGRTATAVRTILSRAREELRRLVRRQVKDYCSSDAEYREEIAYVTLLVTPASRPET